MVIESTTLDTMDKVIEIYGGTTWIQHTGYVLRGASSGVVANSATKTGGEDSHVLTINEIPSHSHYSLIDVGQPQNWYLAIGSNQNYSKKFGQTGTAGGGKAHNNIPNYKSVYIWERTA